MAYGRVYWPIVALSLILCLSSTGRLLGQGSLADYQRAEGLRSRTRGKVFGARVQASQDDLAARHAGVQCRY